MNAEPDARMSRAESDRAPWAVGRLLKWTTDHLKRQGVEDARLSAEVLLAHAMACQRIDLYAHFEAVPDAACLDRFRAWVRRAGKGEPIAYIVEEKEFFSLAFFVSPEVLIPRAETELLVERVIDHCRAASRPSPRILDLGTGSGCIAVSLLVQLPGAEVVASDVSRGARAVARCNAERHGVMDRLTLVLADRFDLPEDIVPDGGFDVICCNPPYVPASEIDRLDRSVREYEPAVALTDGGDGLAFYREIAAEGPRVLTDNGAVFVEIEDFRGPAVIEVMQKGGALGHASTWKDRVVGRERVLMFLRGSGVPRNASAERRGGAAV